MQGPFSQTSRVYILTFDEAFVEVVGVLKGNLMSLVIVWYGLCSMNVKKACEPSHYNLCGIWNQLLWEPKATEAMGPWRVWEQAAPRPRNQGEKISEERIKCFTHVYFWSGYSQNTETILISVVVKCERELNLAVTASQNSLSSVSLLTLS